MYLLVSPWFIGLSILSLVIMIFNIGGLFRACKHHNASPIVTLCGNGAKQPNRGTMIIAVLYVTLTIAYIVIPVILHTLFLSP